MTFFSGLLGNNLSPSPGLLGNQPAMGQMPRVPFRQNPVVTALGASLLAGKRPGGGYDMSALGPAVAVHGQMQQQMVDKEAAAEKRARMGDLMKAWPGLSEQERAWYRENPDQFDPMALREGGESTDDIREYNFAVGQGYKGSLTDFMRDMKTAGATRIDARQMGTVPPGYKANYDDTGNVTSLEPIPGGPVAAEQAAAEKQAEVGVATEVDKAATMLDAVDGIKAIAKDADTPITGTASIPFALYSGTPAGKVRSYVGTLQSGVALGAMMRLKQASATGATGFGNLSEKELQLLIDDIGALNPDNTDPEIFMQTINRIETRWQRVIDDIRKNVSPERIEELGLTDLVNRGVAVPDQPVQSLAPPAPGTVVDGYTFKGGDPADQNNWVKN